MNWDDEKNFVSNPHYRGLGWTQIQWAFSTLWLGVYQPLAWLLLSAQYQIWEMSPYGYHAFSLLLHLGNTLLLHSVLRLGFRPKSVEFEVSIFLAAVLFAIHPLRVEVVAWASCQPYLPCGFFSLLCVRFFLSFRERGNFNSYLMSWACFLAAVGCKVAALPLPLALCVFHYAAPAPHPNAKRPWQWLPFLAVMVGVVLQAFAARDSVDDPGSLDSFAWSSRIAQAAYSVHFPLLRTFWPERLIAFYPIPKGFHFYEWPHLGWLFSAITLTTLAIFARRRYPMVTAMWFGYVILLFPSLGLLRFGDQLTADRYSYLPCMVITAGLAFLIARGWQLSSLPQLNWIRSGALVLTATVFVHLTTTSRRLVLTWRDSVSLWSHALKNGAESSPEVRNNLAIAIDGMGHSAVALEEFDRALKLKPDYVDGHLNRGIALARLRRPAEAEVAFERAVTLAPLNSDAFNNLGFAYLEQGKLAQAKSALEEAMRLNPESAGAQTNLGVLYSNPPVNREKMKEAFRAAIVMDPLITSARNNLALALTEEGDLEGAETLLREVLRINPQFEEAQLHLKTLLARRAAAVK